MQSCLQNLTANIYERPVANLFDVDNCQKLNSILRHGYSLKQREKQQYAAMGSASQHRQAQHDLLNLTRANQTALAHRSLDASLASGTDTKALTRNKIDAGPAPESAAKPITENKAEAKAGSEIEIAGEVEMAHKSEQNKESNSKSKAADPEACAALFNARYQKLAQSIMVSIQDEAGLPHAQSQQVTAELQHAQHNRVYQELGLDLSLKEMFRDLNYDDLAKLRRLHNLYATHAHPPLPSTQDKH
jgi:hypothetical protein